MRMVPGLAVFQGRAQRRHYNPVVTDPVPLVRAEGKVIHVGRQVGTAEGRLVGPDGKLYAHATTTCMIFGYPTAAPDPVGSPS